MQLLQPRKFQILNLINGILVQIFLVSSFTFLLLIVLDNFFTKFVSKFINLNLFLFVIIICGGIIEIIERKQNKINISNTRNFN